MMCVIHFHLDELTNCICQALSQSVLRSFVFACFKSKKIQSKSPRMLIVYIYIYTPEAFYPIHSQGLTPWEQNT